MFVGGTVGVLALWSCAVRFGYLAGIAEQRLELGQDWVLQISPSVSLLTGCLTFSLLACVVLRKSWLKVQVQKAPTRSSDPLQNQLVDVRQPHVSG